MNALDRTAEKQQLTDLRRTRDRLEGCRWVLEEGGGDIYVVAFRGNGDAEHIATIHAAALTDERDLIAGALANHRFLLALVERAAARILAMQDSREQAPEEQGEKVKTSDNNVALSAKGLCGTPIFHRYLEQRKQCGPIADAQTAEAALKKLLGIELKRELNKPGPAREAFRALRWDYYLWKKGDL